MFVGTSLSICQPRLGFDSNSVVDAYGNSQLRQLLFSTRMPAGSTIYDERSGLGTTRTPLGGKAKTFDGTTGYVRANYVRTSPTTGTLSARFKSVSSAVTSRIVAVGSLSNRGFDIYYTTTGFNVLLATDVSNYTIYAYTGGVLSAFDLVGAKFSGTSVTLYLNGVAVAATPTATGTGFSGTCATTDNITIAASTNATSVAFATGQISDVRYYTEALTDAQILAIANNAYIGAPTIHYKLEGNYLDSSGNGYHADGFGTITNYSGKDVPYSFADEVGYTLGRNIFQYSEQFDNAYWSKTHSTITANATTAPDGTLTADKISTNTNTAEHSVTTPSNISVVSGTAYTASVFAKKAEADILFINWSSGGFTAPTPSFFNLTTGVAVAGSGCTVAITDSGNGWYRCSATKTATATIGTHLSRIGLTDSTSSSTSTGANATDGIYIWGAQHEAGSLTDYQKTGATAYTTGGITPRNEAIPTQDVLGNTLQYTGKAPINGLLKQSNCGTFDGVDDYLTVPDSASMNITGAMTFCVWVNGVDDAGNKVICEKGNNGSLMLQINSGNQLYYYGTSNSYSVTGLTSQIFNSTDTLIMYTFDGTTKKLYFNNVLKHTAAQVATTSNASAFNFGGRGASLCKSMKAFGLRLFNKVLSDDERLFIYTNGLQGTDPTTTNLALHLPLANGSGNIAWDASGNGNHGTITNATTTFGAGFWANKQDTYHYNLLNGHSYAYNLETNSEAFGAGRTLTRTTVTPAATTPPSFTSVADKLVETIETGQHHTRANGYTAGVQYTMSVYAKAAERGYLGFRIGSITATGCGFDLLTGTTYDTGANVTNHTITSVGDGWYRCSATCTIDAGVQLFIFINQTKLAHESYTGDGTSGLYLSGWQIVEGASLPQYYKTVATAFDRVRIPAKSATLDANGLPLLNPAPTAGNSFFNGAETQMSFTGGINIAGSVYWEASWTFNTARTNPLFKRTRTTNSIANKADRFLAYTTALSGVNLTNVQAYTATKEG